MGIIGLGAISRKLIEMRHPFRTKIKIHSSHQIEPAFLQRSHAEQTSLEEMIETLQKKRFYDVRDVFDEEPLAACQIRLLKTTRLPLLGVRRSFDVPQ